MRVAAAQGALTTVVHCGGEHRGSRSSAFPVGAAQLDDGGGTNAQGWGACRDGLPQSYNTRIC
eukprot:scaffold178773_cov37-Tisochrysis_lutea.AAC.1